MNAKILAAAGALLAFGTLANAETIDVRFLGTGEGRSVRVQVGSSAFNVFAGQLRHELSNGTGYGAWLNGETVTYCTDLTQHVTSTRQTYDLVTVADIPDSSPMGVAKSNAIHDLYVQAGATPLLSGANRDLTSAFQLAIWEIVTDYNPGVGLSSLNLSTGGFRATRTDGSALWSAVTSQVNTLFAAVGNVNPNSGPSLVGLRSECAQDQVTLIPAPGAVALGGLGMLCMTARRRRA